MKKGILGGLIGVSIVLSIDSLSRVFIALSVDSSILMFSYSEYEGFFWPVFLTFIAMVSSFTGGLFSFTYGKSHKYSSLTTYLLCLILLRYGQIHLLFETETIVYPIAALILSVVSVFLAWKLVFPKAKKPEIKENEDDYHPVNQA